jgi:hypothetical protein
MINFSRKGVNKDFEQKWSKVELCGIPDNTEKEEENFPIQTKDDLFDM